MDPSRTYIDAQGLQWRVSMRELRPTPSERARPCLIFEAAHVIRRVCHYPAHWVELTDAELEALSWRL